MSKKQQTEPKALLSEVLTTYNRTELCAQTSLFANKAHGAKIAKHIVKDFDNEELYNKTVRAQWSLTSLSIATATPKAELPFDSPRVNIEMLVSSVRYDIVERLIYTLLTIKVYTDDFDKGQIMYVKNESPMTDDFRKDLELKDLTGYKSYK